MNNVRGFGVLLLILLLLIFSHFTIWSIAKINQHLQRIRSDQTKAICLKNYTGHMKNLITSIHRYNRAIKYGGLALDGLSILLPMGVKAGSKAAVKIIQKAQRAKMLIDQWELVQIVKKQCQGFNQLTQLLLTKHPYISTYKRCPLGTLRPWSQKWKIPIYFYRLSFLELTYQDNLDINPKYQILSNGDFQFWNI